MLVFCNALTGADKTAEQIGFKAIIKYNGRLYNEVAHLSE